ncbi:MAG: glycine zipper 2TM domain-containing protein [Candidatus Sericytochromatia bacterium]|nr:glycine zipper 2TM domain-containing protein [Candidatus Sericytochromatia bacterium]
MVGGVLGNQIGGGNGKKWARVLGIIAGGVVGNNIESQNSQRSVPGYDLEFYTDEGQFIRIIQTDIGQGFRSGTRVRLVKQNGQTVVTY